MSDFARRVSKYVSAHLPKGFGHVALNYGTVGRRAILSILAQPYSKSNRRRIGRTWGGRRISRLSAEAQTFKEIAMIQARQQFRSPPWTSRIRLDMLIAYPTLKPDMDESLVLDALQGIVYLNDRQVIERHVLRAASTHPFVKIVVEEMLEK